MEPGQEEEEGRDEVAVPDEQQRPDVGVPEIADLRGGEREGCQMVEWTCKRIFRTAAGLAKGGWRGGYTAS